MQLIPPLIYDDLTRTRSQLQPKQTLLGKLYLSQDHLKDIIKLTGESRDSISSVKNTMHSQKCRKVLKEGKVLEQVSVAHGDVAVEFAGPGRC